MLDKYSATGARYLAAASIKIRITLILLRRAWLLIRFPVNDYCPLVTMNWFCDFFFNFVHLDILCACMSCAPRMYNAWADARSPGTRAVDKGEGWEWNFPSLWKTSGCSSDSSSSLWLQCCNICIQLFVWVWVFFSTHLLSIRMASSPTPILWAQRFSYWKISQDKWTSSFRC